MTTVTGLFRNCDETKRVPAGSVIFSEGDRGEEMFGIVKGTVELRIGDSVLGTLGPEEVFGEMALIDAEPRSATAVAVTECDLAVISKRHFLFLVHETPTFALQVMSSMADRIRHPR
jgi:CRP-like cAMP-binding protein